LTDIFVGDTGRCSGAPPNWGSGAATRGSGTVKSGVLSITDYLFTFSR